MTAFPIRVELSPTSLRLGSGQSGELRVDITNISEVVEHYEVLVVGLPSDEFWRCEPEVPKLRPGESATVTVTITVLEDGRLGGGDHSLAVLVRSPYQPSASRAAEFALRVDTVAGVSLVAQPTTVTARSRASYSVLLRNEGNTGVPVQVEASDEEGKARIRVEPPLLQLRPGEALPAQVEVRSRGKLTGRQRRTAITIRGMVGADQVASAQVNLVQNPLIPTMVFSVIGAIVAVAVVAGAILLNGVLGRSNDKPSTQSSTPSAVSTLTSTASGADAPKVTGLTVDPKPALAQAPITVTAKVTGTVDSWAWTVTDADGKAVSSSNQATSLSLQVAEAGDYTVSLVATGPQGGTTTVSEKLTVDPAAPNYRQQTTTVTGLQPGDSQTVTVVCPSDMVPLSGGLRQPTETAAAVTIRDSGPGDNNDWTIDLTATAAAEDLEAVVTCVKEPAEYQVVTQDLLLPAGAVTAGAPPCPTGLLAYGGGVSLRSGAGDKVAFVESRPDNNVDGNFTAWKSTLANTAGIDVTVDISTVCASAADGYVVTTQTIPASDALDSAAAARCPSDTEILGGGVGNKDDSGDPLTDQDAIRLSAPVLDGGAPAWRGTVRHDAQGTGFEMVVYAVCGSPPQ